MDARGPRRRETRARGAGAAGRAHRRALQGRCRGGARAAAGLVAMTAGFVYLVGAGPGDPELLTLKAVKALKRAEVILCDELVSDGVLAHARPEARVVHVGKRGGCRSTPQDFIERLMVAEARA